MKRTAATILVSLVILAAGIAPASAMHSPPVPPVPTPTERPDSDGIIPLAQLPLCVTTTWRSKVTHMPKTRRGEVCRLTKGMWKPYEWSVIDHDGPVLIVQRPSNW